MTVSHLIIGSLIIYVVVSLLFGILPYNLMMKRTKQADASYIVTDDEYARHSLIFGSLTAFLAFVAHVVFYFLDVGIPVGVVSIQYSFLILVLVETLIVFYHIIMLRVFFFSYQKLEFTRPLVGKRALLAIVFFLIWPWSLLSYGEESLVFSYDVVILFGSVLVLYALILPRVFFFSYREFSFTRPLVGKRVALLVVPSSVVCVTHSIFLVNMIIDQLNPIWDLIEAVK